MEEYQNNFCETNELLKSNVTNFIFYFLILIFIYSTLCLFFILINNSNYYIETIPIQDENGVYQNYYYIPFFIFSNYFDKKIYRNE